MSSLFKSIRRYTDTDRERVTAAADRFCLRHGIDVDESLCTLSAVERDIARLADCEDGHRLANLWRRCLGRALKLPPRAGLAIYSGKVGYWI